MRRFFRFSIRDLFWLTLVVGVAVGWFVREQRLLDDRQLHRGGLPQPERAAEEDEPDPVTR